MKDYSDIINLPHHVSPKRAQMSMHDRAAQFSPFATLSGYDDAIVETARVTDNEIELSSDEIELLNEQMQEIIRRVGEDFSVRVTYFQADGKKDGGAFIQTKGVIKRVNLVERKLLFQDETAISLDKIIKIDF